MASDALQRLFQNLQATRRTYTGLLDVAERKQKHILQNNVEELRVDLTDEERLAGEGAALNAERELMHIQCSNQLSGKTDAKTLGDLCSQMPRLWQERFQKERQALKETLEKLHEVNRLNVALVNNSIEMMEGLLSALFRVEQVSAYGRKGVREKPELVRGSLDARA